MSAKLRLTGWFTFMMLVLCIITTVFVLVISDADVTDDAAERLIRIVLDNEDSFEFEHGGFDWSSIDFYKRGVFTAFYTDDGELMRGSTVDGIGPDDLPFSEYELRTFTVGDTDYYIYDACVDMSIARPWIRGVIQANDDNGLMHTIKMLTYILLPALLILSTGIGWLMACRTFRPMEQIMHTANSINDAGDLTRRVDLHGGSAEMQELSRTFDSMFERLERSLSAERQFASDASHELRTPITVIMAQCDRARRKDQSREDFLKSIDVIDEQAHGMSELVQQLLSLTRLQQGTDRYPLAEGDISAFTTACCEAFVPAQERGISLDTDIAPELIARFNPALMSRIIQNLLQNAYKYGRDDGHISVRLFRDGKFVRLCVSDDGIGIAPEDQDRIWRRFWQGDPSRGEDGGSGLGLAMVKEMAEFHGGSAAVESTPGSGSCFTVSLPA